MGHFVPLDKRDLLYLHLVLPVPHIFSLSSFAEAFPCLPKHNPKCTTENRAAGSPVLQQPWAVTFAAGPLQRAAAEKGFSFLGL